MTKNSRRNPSKRRNLLLSKLEDRILFDASLDAGIDPNAGDVNALSSANQPLHAFEQDVANYENQGGENSQQLSPQQTRNELVIVDTSVDHYQQLVDDLLNNTDDDRNIEVVLLDGQSNGIEQVTTILAQYDELDALHLVTHGDDAAIRLGNTWMTSDNLGAFAGQIAGWGEALNSSGDILLYGCDLAESAEGRQLVDSIAALTNSDVAASVDDTGNSIRGGDWNLEYRHGTLESTVIFSQQLQASFQGVLAVGPEVQFQSASQDVMIGEDVQFTVTFQNTGADTGYGPFVDLVFPVNGTDGAAGTDIADGMDFVSATYLGQALNTIELTFPDDGGGTGTIDHPFAVDATGTPLQVTGTAGDKLIVIELPFGSYTTGQPPADIVINATTSNLADLGTDMTVQTRSGFRYGADPLDNPSSDPSIMSDGAVDSAIWTEQLTVTPTLMELTKTYLGPEDETATGPNHVQQYQIDIDVADGQTISNLDIIDSLPPNVVVTSIDSVLVNGAAATYTDNLGSLSFPGNSLDLIVTPTSDVSGTTSATDVTVVISFYVTEFDADGNRVIPISGEDDTTSGPDSRSFNNARAVGDWTPIDARDTGGTDNAVADPDSGGPEHILDDKAIAIQKSVAIVTNVGVSGANPGDTLEYTLNFQISDFYTFGDLIIDDIFQDGQLFDFTYGATFTVTDMNGTVTGNFTVRSITDADGGETLVVDETDIDRTDDTGEVGSGPSDGSDGETTLRFDLSQAIIDEGGADGILQGGYSNGATNGGAATGTITFRTVIQEEYADAFQSGDRSVDQGDRITNNNLSITGTVRDNAEDGSINDVIHTESDTSSASVVIATGTLIKDVYAINGNTTLPTGPSGKVSLTPGDVVTYRIQYTVPTSDFEDLVLTDYLPLPIFDATDHNADGVITLADNWTFDDSMPVDGTTPASGVVKFGSNDTFYNSNPPSSNITPTITVGASNELQLTFGSYDDPSSQQSVIEVYFSITAADEPTADGLFLTNIVRASEGTTQNIPTIIDKIVQVEVLQPELNITKGIVSSDNTSATFDSTIGPAGITFGAAGTGGALFSGGVISSTALTGQPINANITGGIDAGDTIRYAVVLENTGNSTRGAYDVAISDSLPAGFTLVGGSVRIVDGTGAAITYTGAEADLFTTGITLDDPGATPDTGDGTNAGSIDGYDAVDGENVVIVFYDVTADASVEANQTYVNTAFIENFAGQEGGANHAANRPSDDASAQIENVSVTKSIVSTSEAHTTVIGGVERVTIGEIVRYQVQVALPEGSMTGLQIHDVLPQGLTFVDDGTATVTFIADGIGITSSTVVSGVLPDSAISAATGSDDDNYTTGRDIYFKLGDIDNNDSDTNIEYAVIEFNVLVDNNNLSSGARNDTGESRYNDVRVHTNGAQIYDMPEVNRPRVIIAEPRIDNIDKAGSITTGDAGDTITYTVTFDAATGDNQSDAFNVRLLDTLPTDMTLVSLDSVMIDGAGATYTGGAAGNTIDILLARVNKGQSVQVVYTATIDLTVSPEDVLANTANVTWSSLPDDFGTGVNATGSDLFSLNGINTGDMTYDTTSGALHGQRDGSDGAGVNPNDYATSDSHSVTIDGVTTFTKTLVSTEFDDAFNGASDVVIGELVTYRLTVAFPEGTTPNAVILDTLDNGLAFVGQTSSSLNDVAITGTLIPLVGGNGRTMTWDFGTVTDANLANNTEGFITIEYQAVVLNVAGNQAGTSLDNIARFTWNNDPGTALDRDAADVTVREPHVEVTKSVEVNAPSGDTTGDAGDPVEYTIVIENTGDYDAFDVTFSDDLPTVSGGTSAILGAALFSVVDSAGTLTAADFTLSGDDTTGYSLSLNGGVDLDLLKIDGARTITLTVNGTIAPTNGPNDIISNTANAQWTSLDGDVTTRSTYTTDDNGERDGTNPGDNTHDYDDGGTASFSINPPVFTKSLFGTDQTETSGSDVTIGERVTYALLVTLPEGTTSGMDVTDLLPPGLNYESYQLVTTVAGSAGLLTADFNGTITGGTPTVSGGASDGDDVTFTFGQIDVNDDNLSTNNSFLILLTAAISDVSSNVGYGVGQTTLSNTATIDVFGDSVAPLSSNSIDVDVIESNLVITKDIDKALVDADEQITITLQIDNTGLGDAYEVRLEDLLLAAHYDLGTVNIGASGTDYPADFTANYNSITGLLEYSGGTIAAGGNVTFTITLDMADTVAPGATLVNTATITNASTLQGTVAGERDNPDPDNDGSDTNDDSVTVRTNSLAGNVYFDADNDGVFDGTESGIESVDVRLQGIDHLGNTVDITVQTLADGSYLFDDLRPGTYRITETQPATAVNGKDYLDGTDTIGTPGGNDTVNDEFSNIVLSTGVETHGTDNNFGELEEAELSGFVWHDADNDGVKDVGEVGIGGVDVTLTGTDDLGGITPVTVTTNPDGSYTFDGLRPGQYTITETQPTGAAASGRDYIDGLDTDGSLANGVSANDVTSSIDAAAGETGIDYNFGEVVESTISGFVYHDSDNDGDRTTETGIEFVDITLTGTDDLGNTVNLTTQTDSSGYYEFANLRPAGVGGYTLTQSQPTGYLDGIDTIGTPGGNATVNDVFSSINVVSDSNGTENNFGELLPASISGTVFHDLNNDGLQQAGELGIGGVQIQLTGTDDLGNAVNVTVSTNPDGTYSIAGLRPSDATGYTLTETQPTNYNDGIDSDGSLANGDVSTNDVNSSINIVSDDAGTGYNFAERGASISGTVYVDEDGDGNLTGTETRRVDGVTVELYDSTGTTLLATTTTAVDGTYSFDNLPADDYVIRQIQPTDFSSTTPNQINATLPLGGLANQNFGEEYWELGGNVYFDADNDGVFDGTETGIENVDVRLQGIDYLGNTVDTTIQTLADGSYLFVDLLPGTYSITETQPTTAVNGKDYLDGSDTIGTPGGDDTVNDEFGNIVLGSGVATSGLNNNFGELEEAELSGFVWHDADNDGVKDVGEVGIGGVDVTLTGTDDLGGITPVTVTTNPDGSYTFDGLRPGQYTITETQPTGAAASGRDYIDGLDTDGSLANGVSANDVTSSIDAAAGETGIDYNFGEVVESTISGFVYHDSDNDGDRTTETGIEFVDITLTGTDDLGNTVNLTTQTDSSGYYEFANLRPAGAGGYTLTQSQPAGYLDGIDTIGTPGGNATVNDVFSSINVVSDSNGTENNFGELLPASISGTVFHDLNNDGLQQAGELGIGGVQIQLTGTDDLGNAVNVIVSTNPDGTYSIAGLRPSDATGYTLTETQPTNYNDGIDSDGSLANGDVSTNDVNSSINIVSDDAGTGYNFAERGASISGTVYVDEDGDGNLTGTETRRVDGVTVELYDSTGTTLLATTTTAVDGTYSFDNLPADDYVIRQIQPTDFSSTTPNQINATLPLGGLANQDFGEEYWELGGNVYFDADNDGVFDGTETGIENVDVRLQGIDYLGNTVDTTIQTLADGSYLFVDLLPGTYSITETQPTTAVNGKDYLDGSDTIGTPGGDDTVNDEFGNIVLGAGVTTSGLNNNFGELEEAELSGFVWHDADNDGVKDVGEVGIGGVDVTLTGTDDLGGITPVTVTTNPDGSYTFDGLRPGQYTITETQPTGAAVSGRDYIDGLDTDGSLANGVSANDVTSSIDAAAGETGIDYNFGEVVESTISGFVYHDSDNDGDRTTETGIEFVDITLTGTDDLGNTVNLTTQTDSSGYYEFANLRPAGAGGYTLTQSQPAGYLDGIDTIGTPGGNATVNDVFSSINVVSDSDGTENNFGELLPASVSGTVFNDHNNDGSQQAGEEGIGGVQIQLTGTDDLGNAVNVTVSTNPDGTYSIAGLRPSDATGYTLTETQPTNYNDGIDSDGSLANGDVSTNDVNSSINIVSDDAGTGYNFAERGASISGTVYVDEDGDGNLTGTETRRVDGVTVELYDSTGTTLLATTTTAVDGTYSFDNLPADDYVIRQIQPTDFSSTTPNQINATLPLGGLANQDFGEEYWELGGNVYFDADNDGVFDGTETGIENVDVRLQGIDYLGNTVDTTIQTLADGSYLFVDLLPGTYSITETQPTTAVNGKDYLDGSDTIGTPGGDDTVNDEFGNIVLGAGVTTSGLNNNFGELEEAELSGFVWHDADNDGVKDVGEVGIGGVDVTLTGTDDLGGITPVTVTTNPDGSYTFDGLRPGQYTITETQPTGAAASGRDYIDGLDTDGSLANGVSANDVTSSIDAAAGETGIDYNFGEVVESTISGFVYHDSDNDGDRTTETGIEFVDITLTGTDDLGNTVNLTTQTDSSGYYEFANLRPAGAGGYTLTQSQPAGYLDGIDTIGTPGGNATVNDVFSSINVVSDSNGTENNFGELLPASVSGTVFNDHNNDGSQQAGEEGIGGVQIQLTGTDDLGNAVNVTVSTNPDGTYSIAGLRPSDATGYTLTETQPTNYNDGIDSDGSLANGDVSTNDVNSSINIVSDDAGTGYNFAERGASISGTVYVDEDGDGNLTGTETRRVDGVTVELYDSTGTTLLATTTTAVDGTYSFDNLPADDYVIRQIQPTDFSSTTPNQINATLPLGGLANQDFGEEYWELGGNVYFDADNDGVFDGTETGIENVDVRLQGIDYLGNTVDTTIQTLADGSYLFVDLLPGTYSITETQPTTAVNGKDYLDGSDTIGTPGGDDTVNDEFGNIVLGAGVTTSGLNNNFGELEEAELSGFVWHDADNDGVKDVGEVGIGGVDVTLTGTDDLGGITPVTVTTNPDGSYTFDGLRPGQYTITETQPTGAAASGRDYIDGLDTDGSLANGVSANDVTSSIDAAAGETGIDYNFGEVVESTISGFVYHDSDNDGDRTTETGIEFVDITLTGTDDLGNTVNLTTQTDSSGYYEFANLRPAGAGGYTLTQSQPAGYLDGIDTIGTPGGNATVNDVFSSINVVSDSNGTENNFGELLPASVSGTVFNDHNNDGSQQAGEEGIGGVQIQLTGTDDLGNAVNVTVSTNPDGTYSIAGLRPSDATGYTLTETQPTNYNDGIDSDGSLANGDVSTNDVNSSINIVSDDAGTGYNFAEQGTSISGTIYVDDNRDGMLDVGDIGRVSGVLIELYDSTGTTLIASTMTDSNGDYQFDYLPADDYVIREIHPAQYSSTTPDVLNTTLPLTGLSSQNFGENLWDLGDFVWFDTDGNGVQDTSEPGLENIGVTLTYAGVDDDFSTTADNIVYNTMTDANGAYGFDDLFNGAFRVTITSVDLPGGVTGTEETDDSAAAIDGTSNITVGGGDRFGVDFGYTGTGSVGDTVFWDQNNNGAMESNEIGLAGIVVELDIDLDGDGTAELTLTTTTDANGEYLFERVPAGNHVVRVTQPSGTVQTFDSDGTLSGNQSTVGLTPGEDNVDQNFGFRGTGQIGDTVFYDRGDDGGAFGAAGDYGLAGVRVTLEIDVDGDGSVDLTRNQTTDANGEYLFENLIAGDYRVTLEPTDLPAALGSHATVDRDGALNHETDVTLADGQSVDNADFGYFATPEYEVIKTDDLAGAPGTPGTTFSYFLFVSNNGDMDGTGVVVTDDLPIHVLDRFSIVTDDPANVSYDPLTGRLIWTAGDLSGLGGNKTLQVTVTVQDPVGVLLTTFDNTATVADDGNHGADPISGNNTSTDPVSLVAAPDYEIEKTSSLTETAMLGDSFFYTIRVSNIGDQDGTGVVATDHIPVSVLDRFNVTTSDPANVSYDPSTGELIWNVGDLNGRGDTRTLTVFVEIPFAVEDPLADVIVNTATVTDDGANGPEDRLDNNSSTVQDEVLVFAFDSNNNFSASFSPNHDPSFGWEHGDSARTLRPLPVDPIFSGLAEPGTTLSLKIYDDEGNVIGERQVVADSGGNWLANFPNTVIWKHPYRMDVEQTAPIQTDVHELDGFNMRRYFHPAIHSSLFLSEQDTVSSVMRNSAYETIDSMHGANNNPLQVGWRSHLYQLNVSSTNAAGD